MTWYNYIFPGSLEQGKAYIRNNIQLVSGPGITENCNVDYIR